MFIPLRLLQESTQQKAYSPRTADASFAPEAVSACKGLVEYLAKYNPNQPRDRQGRFATGGAIGGRPPYSTKAKAQWRKMLERDDPEALSAIRQYGNFGYEKVSRTLRSGHRADAETKRMIAGLDRAFRSAPKYTETVYRGIELHRSEVGAALRQFRPGRTLRMKSFASTSKSEKVAKEQFARWSDAKYADKDGFDSDYHAVVLRVRPRTAMDVQWVTASVSER
jgi:hypothetical protein